MLIITNIKKQIIIKYMFFNFYYDSPFDIAIYYKLKLTL